MKKVKNVEYVALSIFVLFTFSSMCQDHIVPVIARNQFLKNGIPLRKDRVFHHHDPKKVKTKEPLWERLETFAPKVFRNFLVIIPSYNNKDWYTRNLDSVFMQDYPFYHVIYIDDCSTDGTGDLVARYIKEKRQDGKVTFVCNKERMRALANIYASIYDYGRNDDIVVVLDGDDWWAHDHVLALLNKVYNKFDVWITYGSHEHYPSGKRGVARKLPDKVIDTNSVRKYEWVTSQQRTFYAWLFKLIKKEDLLYDDKFYSVSGDVGVMLPMIEMAGPKSMFIPDIIYIYNMETPLNNKKVNPGVSMSSFIRQKQPYGCEQK